MLTEVIAEQEASRGSHKAAHEGVDGEMPREVCLGSEVAGRDDRHGDLFYYPTFSILIHDTRLHNKSLSLDEFDRLS